MRFLKLAFVFLLVLTLAILLATNMQPKGRFTAPDAGYAPEELTQFGQELRVSRIEFDLDPFGLGSDLLPSLLFSLPLFALIVLAVGLFMGATLENVRARRMRRELREKRDEAVMLKAELHRARETLKTSDHPASAATSIARR